MRCVIEKSAYLYEAFLNLGGVWSCRQVLKEEEIVGKTRLQSVPASLWESLSSFAQLSSRFSVSAVHLQSIS